MRTILFSLLVGLSVACASREASDEGTDTTRQAATVAREPRPERLVDSLQIEGMMEPVRLHLYTAPEDFPLGFSTYLPEDMSAEPVSSDEGDALRLTSNPSGEADGPQAGLTFFVFPERTSEAEATQRAQEVATGGGETSPDTLPTDLPWMRAFYLHTAPGGAHTRSVRLGTYQGRYFYFMEEYPSEMSEGFGPRVRLVLREWRWQDTGNSL
ncbi:hypothetical protein SAMN05421823_102110 [Catalinimonas alkaloidigena]|uniref:Lipoprotein n=1 Tax=Catalinimonas alkaloidigena TaxID=1075417 RepID=A0A1G8ZWF0_9BACT|nr:hypothetical protein [Catalinimonas alkaloidigena]SDK19446.1 hypothetical protein SAMN05421823_102110 [Catalinimonas alkaloidigena]